MSQPISAERFCALVNEIETQVSRVIVGQKNVIRHVLVSILAGGHVLLEGVPGLGKTMLIRTLGQVLDLKFSRIQFTPDLMPADITGTEVLTDHDGVRAFHFQPGPIFANLVLADEINRATPKTQSAMLEAMQEHSVTIANQTRYLEQPFFVLATQNPLEMEGTYPLPEAQLDRFFFKVNLPFPDSGEIVEILTRTTGADTPQASQVASSTELLAMRELARAVPIATHVTQYIARLNLATHPNAPEAPPIIKKYVRYGASPRGGQALILGGKVTALMAGRYNVAFEDIDNILHAALRHRILLNFEGMAEGIQADDILTELLSSITP